MPSTGEAKGRVSWGTSMFTPLAERVAACSHTEHRTVRMVFSGRYEPDAEWEPCPPVEGRVFSSEVGGSTAHEFVCVVCRKPGECDGDCDRDPAAHVHFATECWEEFRG